MQLTIVFFYFSFRFLTRNCEPQSLHFHHRLIKEFVVVVYANLVLSSYHFIVSVACNLCCYDVFDNPIYGFISRGPVFGSRGKVMLPFEDNPLSKIGVRFDKPVTDGVDFGGLCEMGYGFFCNGMSS